MEKILARITKVKPEETKIAVLFFFHFFLVIAPYNIVKSVRNASFLTELGWKYLPFAYLLTAAVIGGVVAFHSKVQLRLSRPVLIISSLIFFAVTSLVFWILGKYSQWTQLPYLYWIWTNMFIVVLTTQFWILVNDFLNPREFKRLSGFLVSGGILGGILGAALAGFLAEANVDYDLLPLAAGFLFLCVMDIALIFRWQRSSPAAQKGALKTRREIPEILAKPGFRDSLNTVWNHTYLKLIAIIVLVTLVVSTLIDFQFNTIVDTSERGSLTSFFGFFNSGLMIVAFLISLMMTSNFFKRYGVRLALLLYPSIILLCSVGIMVVPFLVLAILIKGSDKSLSYSINRSARELLYIPVPPDLKYKAMVFIEMFVDRFSKGIGALVILIVMFASGSEDPKALVRLVSLVSVVFVFGWMVLTLRASREYVDSVKRRLFRKWESADRVVAGELDLDFTRMIFDAIESMDQSSNLYAMHLFDLLKQGKLTPELKKFLAYRSQEIIPASWGVFFEADSSALIQADVTSLGDAELKKEIEEVMSLDMYLRVMSEYFEKTMAGKGENAKLARMEIAKGIGFLDPDSPLVAFLARLLEDDSAEVRRYAIESAGRLGKMEYVQALIKLLRDPGTQADVAAALEKYGEKIAETLGRALSDSGLNIQVRKTIASILGRIDGQEAADRLLWALAEYKGEMDNELIDALDDIRARKSDILVSKEIVKKKTGEEIRKYYRLFIEFAEAEAQGDENAVCQRLSKEFSRSIVNTFKLLGLIYPHEDMVKSYQNIQVGTKDSMAYAIELLDNTLEREIRDAVWPMVEDLTREEKLKACLALQKNFPKF
jgi:AAA family ATP:ADP antiporter